ncbi:MAG: magnesium transporter CorA family protein [Actinomycetota bacterium]
MLRAFTHSDSQGWSEVSDLSTISDALEAGTLLWAFADIGQLNNDDIATIEKEFGLHPLAVEDALSPRQRPKLEAYENHLFVVIHQLDEEDGQLEARQVACFAGKNYVLTLHDRSQRTIDAALQRCHSTSREPGRGPSWLMHALIDTVVDEYQKVADALEAEVEELEDAMLVNPMVAAGNQIYSIKQRLSRLRRYVGPGARTLSGFVESSQAGPATAQTAAYFRDVLDHILRINDQIHTIDELSNALTELRRTAEANALGDTTKRLTGWAAIIAVPTFIASVYGMNFKLVPEDGRLFGFWFALGTMGLSSVVLYVYFKRRRWI